MLCVFAGCGLLSFSSIVIVGFLKGMPIPEMTGGMLVCMSLFTASICNLVIKVKQYGGQPVLRAWDRWLTRAFFSALPSVGALFINEGIKRHDDGLILGGILMMGLYLPVLLGKHPDKNH